MKQFLLISMCTILLSSCEDVVDVDLNEAGPRLVIDAHINILIDSGASFNSFVQLTTTAPFFDNQIPVVEDASVQIVDSQGTVFPFEHQEDGIYEGTFFPEINSDYTLQVLYDNELYTATTHLVPTPQLEYVEQRDDGGFFGDQIELKAYFTDFPNERNFYFFFAASERGIRRDVFNDEFFEGNSIFGLYLADDLIAGDIVQFNLYGITEEYYNYMFILLQQTGGNGGPFETQPATVRGNIVNETNPENYPLGYFRMSELSILEYKVK